VNHRLEGEQGPMLWSPFSQIFEKDNKVQNA
jgi:hypothetical protein